MADNNPIFIGGLMRSGTTLLRAMLGQHSAIAAGLETHWFDLDWRAGKARHGVDLTSYLDQLAEFFGLPRDRVQALAADSQSAEDFLDRFMACYAETQGKPRWAEKTPGNCRQIARILAYWPDAKILHITRHPRDVFASFRRSNKYGGPADYGALWADYLGAVEAFKADHPSAAAASVMEVSYEQLVNAPARLMRQVGDFCDLRWEETLAVFEGKQDEYDKVQELTGHASTTLEELAKPLTTGNIGSGAKVIGEQEMAEARAVVASRGLGELFDAVIARAEAVRKPAVAANRPLPRDR